MPPKRQPAIIEQVQEVKWTIPEKQKRTRRMTPEALEKLKLAREKALQAKKNGKEIDEELQQAKKESFSEKIDQVETYRKLKQRVEDEVKQNEIISINKKMEDLHNSFQGFLQDRQQHKAEKALRKEKKKVEEIAQALPLSISQKLLEEEIKRQELIKFRAKMFGN